MKLAIEQAIEQVVKHAMGQTIHSTKLFSQSKFGSAHSNHTMLHQPYSYDLTNKDTILTHISIKHHTNGIAHLKL